MAFREASTWLKKPEVLSVFTELDSPSIVQIFRNKFQKLIFRFYPIVLVFRIYCYENHELVANFMSDPHELLFFTKFIANDDQ